MKIISLLLVILHFAILTFSQTYVRKTPEEKAKKYTDEMATDISLDSVQYQQIYLINVDVSKRFDSMYTSKPTKDLQRQATIEILKSRDNEFRKVLTNQQFLRFDDIQREKREKKQKEKAEKERLGKEAQKE